MNNKSSRTAKLSLVLIVVFTIALLALIGMATWRNNASAKLEAAVRDLGIQNTAVSLADSSRQKFFFAGNSFWLFIATGQEKHKAKYIESVIGLQQMLLKLEKQIGNRTDSTSLQSLLKKKSDETEIFLRLRATNDSLIRETVKLKNLKAVNLPLLQPINPKEVNILEEETTPVKTHKSDRNFFQRLLDATGNRSPPHTAPEADFRRPQNSTDGLSASQRDVTDNLRSSIQKLTFNYKLVSESERRLILNNDRLLTRLSTILQELEELQSEARFIHDEQLKREAKISLEEISKITRLIIFISVVLALVIFLSAWQLYKHDKILLAARNEAIRQTHIRGDFLSHMSHEIRTPLNSILGFSEQLENSTLNVSQMDQLSSIRQSSRILLSIVNDVLDLSKFATGNVNLHTTNFYPEKTIKHVVASLQVLASKKNLTLVCNCVMNSELRLAGDEYRLKQVLINFINNAIKFTELGRVSIQATVSENSLFVEVSDTGKGIAKENLEHIFEEFIQITGVQDKERHNGSGLGLAICKKIIEAQGGEIQVKSVIGKGSSFSFQIPYLPFQAALETDLQKQSKPPLDTSVLLSKTLLVAEDEKMNIKLISSIFKKWGVTFDVVESGRLAFESFQNKSYDMILTDIHMPDGDGISLAKMVRTYPDKIKSQVPILAITANAMQKDLEEYNSIGMNDYVVKPFSEETLFETIAKNLELFAVKSC